MPSPRKLKEHPHSLSQLLYSWVNASLGIQNAFWSLNSHGQALNLRKRHAMLNNKNNYQKLSVEYVRHFPRDNCNARKLCRKKNQQHARARMYRPLPQTDTRQPQFFRSMGTIEIFQGMRFCCMYLWWPGT